MLQLDIAPNKEINQDIKIQILHHPPPVPWAFHTYFFLAILVVKNLKCVGICQDLSGFIQIEGAGSRAVS